MRSSSPCYHAYLLRIWLSRGAGQDACWQASMQDAAGGRGIEFASLEELFVFLMNEIADTPKGTSRNQKPPPADGRSIAVKADQIVNLGGLRSSDDRRINRVCDSVNGSD